MTHDRQPGSRALPALRRAWAVPWADFGVFLGCLLVLAVLARTVNFGAPARTDAQRAAGPGAHGGPDTPGYVQVAPGEWVPGPGLFFSVWVGGEVRRAGTALLPVAAVVGAALAAALVSGGRTRERAPAEVLADPRASRRERRWAVAALGARVGDDDPLLAGLDAWKGERGVATTLVAQLRLHPSPERLARLAQEAERSFGGWAAGEREQAAWLLVADAARAPDGPEAEARVATLLRAPDPMVRRLAMNHLGAVGTRAAVRPLREGLRAGALPARAEAAVEAIAQRAGVEVGGVSVAPATGGELAEVEPARGRLSVRDG